MGSFSMWHSLVDRHRPIAVWRRENPPIDNEPFQAEDAFRVSASVTLTDLNGGQSGDNFCTHTGDRLGHRPLAIGHPAKSVNNDVGTTCAHSEHKRIHAQVDLIHASVSIASRMRIASAMATSISWMRRTVDARGDGEDFFIGSLLFVSSPY